MSKALYKSTSFVEQNINRVPAFLAARRLFIEQGMTEKEANEKALEVSDDIHFRYGKQHRPRFMRGRIGTLFVFNHYTRSLLFQLYRNLKAGEFAVFARKMLYTSALGGAISLPFARTMTDIFKKIFGVGGDDEEEKEMSKWEIALKHGLPASITGIDLSGRVGIDILSVNSILDDPDSVKNYLGVVGSLLWYSPDPDKSGRIIQALELIKQGRFEDAAGKALPDMFSNLVKAYTGYNWGVRSFSGTPLENANGDVYKYNTWEAIIKATGFSPIQETLNWNAKSNEWITSDKQQEDRTRLRREIQMLVQKGDFEKARELQAKAVAEEIISEKTDYVRDFGKDTFFGDALKAVENGESLKAVENELITNIYGADASDAQRNNARKDFAVYRSYGTKNKFVNDLMTASTNKDKVDILKKVRESMTPEEFNEFMKKGRKTISTESGNPSRILISDELYSMFNASKDN